MNCSIRWRTHGQLRISVTLTRSKFTRRLSITPKEKTSNIWKAHKTFISKTTSRENPKLFAPTIPKWTSSMNNEKNPPPPFKSLRMLATPESLPKHSRGAWKETTRTIWNIDARKLSSTRNRCLFYRGKTLSWWLKITV